ncbi:YkgJ family cysteine cluster protein [Enterocloster asparagiformis]
MMFNCDKCGECCRNLDKSPIYSELDRGDGICRYLIGNLCSIYEKRPMLCRIDESYDLLFKDKITRSEFYKLNQSFCIKLKNHKL